MAYGLGEPDKTLPEIVEQIHKNDEFFEKALYEFIALRANKEKDTTYYTKNGSDKLKYAVSYLNRINNRIAMLWIAYKREIEGFHKERGEVVYDDNFPKPESIQAGEFNKGDMLIAKYDFKSNGVGQMSISKGDLVEYKSQYNGWAKVKTDQGKLGYVPMKFLAMNSKPKIRPELSSDIDNIMDGKKPTNFLSDIKKGQKLRSVQENEPDTKRKPNPLLAELNKGTTRLKPVTPKDNVDKVMDGKKPTSLIDEIKDGVQLKKTPPRTKFKGAVNAVMVNNELMQRIMGNKRLIEKINQRRETLANQSDEESSVDDNEWSAARIKCKK